MALLAAAAIGFGAIAPAEVRPLVGEHVDWNRPVAPFRIAGNLYYVGAENVSAFAIRTAAGVILIDAGFPQTAPQIVRNLATLGLKIEDVRYILTSQAHFDHVGGVAELKRLSGAKLVMSAEDAALIARGGRRDFAFGDRFAFPPAKADRIIGDGDAVELGGVRVTAHLTPGHTKGCTSWSFPVEENGQTLQALNVCGVTAPGYRLTGNSAYPNLVTDFRTSFDRLDALPCQIFLSAHGHQFGLAEKRAALAKGAAANPFIDEAGCRALVRSSRADFEAELAKQTAAKK